MQFHTRLAVHSQDTAAHLIHTNPAHMAQLRAWTWSPRPHQAHACTFLPLAPQAHTCAHPLDMCHSHPAHLPDGTHPSKMAFSLATRDPWDHPSSQAPKWSFWLLALPGGLAAGKRARGWLQPLRSCAAAANSPHLGFIYSSHPLL